MEATNSRNELVRILADVYQASSTDEIEPTTYLIQGRLAPFFEPVEIGLGERLLISAMATAYDRPKESAPSRPRSCRTVSRGPSRSRSPRRCRPEPAHLRADRGSAEAG